MHVKTCMTASQSPPRPLLLDKRGAYIANQHTLPKGHTIDDRRQRDILAVRGIAIMIQSDVRINSVVARLLSRPHVDVVAMHDVDRSRTTCLDGLPVMLAGKA